MFPRAGFALLLLLAAAPVSAQDPPRPAIEPALARLADRAPGQPVVAWIYFTDRAGAERELSSFKARAALSLRALERRARRGELREPTASDLPVHAPYVRALTARGARIRGVSRWLNAASIEAPAGLVAELARLPFVAHAERLARARRIEGPEPVGDAGPKPEWAPPAEQKLSSSSLNAVPGDLAYYGNSFRQLSMMQVPQLHALGLSGAGVLVCMIDAGFRTTHQAFQSLDIVATRDFQHNDSNVGEQAGQDSIGQANHGTWTLGCVAGSLPGTYTGAAFGASVALAKTEWVPTEHPIEMDWWQFAAEWADSLGADVISSSLGYFGFDPPDTDLYVPADLDGRTTVVARAALEAARRGIVVVSSAGNGGLTGLGSPADADSIISVGAVDSVNALASFSSRGPTADGRIKPDVVAMGRSVYLVHETNSTAYRRASGTSFSCPLTAGVVALLLEAHPWWRPYEMIEALHGTSLNAATPNNDIGWGLVQGLAARDWIPSTLDVPAATSRIEMVAGPNPLRSGSDLVVRFAGGPATSGALDLFDLGGRRVARLFEGAAAGPQIVRWSSERPLPSGVYWLRLALREGGREASRSIKVVVAR